MPNIKDLHSTEKPVSAHPLFKAEDGRIMALRIGANQVLKEHSTKIPALLICMEGEVVFEYETGFKVTLKTGDYINIEPMVIHWVTGILESHLLLMR